MAYLEIRDGLRATDNLIGRYCGSSLPPTVTSTMENMYIRFYHNAASGSVGFRASFGAGKLELVCLCSNYNCHVAKGSFSARGHSFSTYARRGGGGVKQMRTNAYKGGGGVDT